MSRAGYERPAPGLFKHLWMRAPEGRRVTVVIASCGRLPGLRRTVASLLAANTYPIDRSAPVAPSPRAVPLAHARAAPLSAGPARAEGGTALMRWMSHHTRTKLTDSAQVAHRRRLRRLAHGRGAPSSAARARGAGWARRRRVSAAGERAGAGAGGGIRGRVRRPRQPQVVSLEPLPLFESSQPLEPLPAHPAHPAAAPAGPRRARCAPAALPTRGRALMLQKCAEARAGGGRLRRMGQLLTLDKAYSAARAPRPCARSARASHRGGLPRAGAGA
jgi:hypothetical protein